MIKKKPRKRELPLFGAVASPITPAEFKEWRERLGFTQENAAAFFGVTLRTIENWEQGVSKPRPSIPIRLQMQNSLRKGKP